MLTNDINSIRNAIKSTISEGFSKVLCHRTIQIELLDQELTVDGRQVYIAVQIYRLRLPLRPGVYSRLKVEV